MADLPPLDNSPQDVPAAPVGDRAAPGGQPQRWQRPRQYLGWTLRWLGLGVGVGVMWIAGVGVAQLVPSRAEGIPLQEGVLRQTQRMQQRLRRLPDWWAGDMPAAAPVSLEPSSGVGSPGGGEASAPAIDLTAAQTDQIETELVAIQGELQRLRDRASALEVQMGLPSLSEPLEVRLARVAGQLAPGTAAEESAPPTAEDRAAEESPGTTAIAPPAPPPAIPSYRVTLPSDILFPPGETVLQGNAAPLLDSILGDVSRYPGAIILVGSYTDGAGDGDEQAALTFQQAIAVQRYLADRLGDEEYRWIAVGYGNNALGTGGGSTLPRRIAIAIVPAP